MRALDGAHGRRPPFGTPTHPWGDLRCCAENSLYYLADRIQTPMLILQGGEDGFHEEVEHLFTALRRLGKPAQLLIYENAGHSMAYWPLPKAIDSSMRLMDFYREHLSPLWQGGR